METSKFQSSLALMNDAMRATGIPFDGYTPRPARPAIAGPPPVAAERVHFTEGKVGYFIEIHFPEGTSQAQRLQLQAIVDGFSFTRRKAKSDAALYAEVRALPQADQLKLLAAMAVDFLKREPGFAKRLGINLTGDEDDLTPESAQGGKA